MTFVKQVAVVLGLLALAALMICCVVGCLQLPATIDGYFNP